MKIRKVAFALALLLMVGVAIALPGTIAYIAAKTDTIVNTFNAPHFPPDDVSVNVQVQKIVHNVGTDRIGPEGFQFVLLGQNNEKHILTSGKNGQASVVLPFTEADLGKTFEYRLYEINDGREDVTYDKTVYDVSITIALDEDKNALIASVKVDGKAAQPVFRFENTYASGSAVPLTGDEMNIGLCTMLLAVSGLGLLMLVRRKAWQ